MISVNKRCLNNNHSRTKWIDRDCQTSRWEMIILNHILSSKQMMKKIQGNRKTVFVVVVYSDFSFHLYVSYHFKAEKFRINTKANTKTVQA